MGAYGLASRALRWGFSFLWAPSSCFPRPGVLNPLHSWAPTQIHSMGSLSSMFCKNPPLFFCPFLAFSENKEEVQWQMSSCKVIKLVAWGPVLLRVGQRGRVGVHNRSVRRDLLLLTSFHPLVEVALPHVAVQVVTLWDTGALGSVLGHAGTVHKTTTSWLHWSLDAAGFPPRGNTGCLRKGFVPSEPMNQLIKGKAGLTRASVVGRRKREELVTLSVVARGQKFSFFTEGSDRDCNKKNLS